MYFLFVINSILDIECLPFTWWSGGGKDSPTGGCGCGMQGEGQVPGCRVQWDHIKYSWEKKCRRKAHV